MIRNNVYYLKILHIMFLNPLDHTLPNWLNNFGKVHLRFSSYTLWIKHLDIVKSHRVHWTERSFELFHSTDRDTLFWLLRIPGKEFHNTRKRRRKRRMIERTLAKLITRQLNYWLFNNRDHGKIKRRRRNIVV